MSPLFGKKCTVCDFVNNSDARYCSKCGSPLAGGTGKKCSVCGADNANDATFCKKCGRPLAANEEAELHGNHWARRDNDFAIKINVSDLPGLLSKKLEVEIGTQALIVSNSTAQEILPPGVYTLDSVGKTVANWLSGVPKTVTALLVETSPKEIVIPIQNRFTSDPLPISLSMRIVVEVENASKFLVSALSNRERYSTDDLKAYIEPEIAYTANKYLQDHTLEQLVENPSTRKELELAVEEALRITFAQYGLKLVFLRTVEMDLETFDKIKGIKGKYSLIVEEGLAELNGKEDVLELQKSVDLFDLAERTSKIEKDEKLAELNRRIHQAALSSKMDDVRSEADFEKFLDSIDREKLLAKKDREDLLRGWREEAEDHDRARAFLLAKTEVDEKFQLRAIEIKSTGELAVQEQDFRLELERKRAGLSIQIEEEKWQADIRRRKMYDDLEKAEAEDDIDLLIKLKKEKMLLENQEAELAMNRRLAEARANIDMEIARQDAEHKRELERLDKLSTLGTEALIAASSVEQGKILQDLKRTELLKGMSEEQILAMAAEKSPELGRVFEEKYRAIAEGKADQREREMYEKLLASNQNSQQVLLDLQKDAMDRLQQMSQHNIDAIKDVSSSFANGSGTVIIGGPMGGSVIRTSKSGVTDSYETKTCPSCGRQVAVDSRFCEFCGNVFKDVK